MLRCPAPLQELKRQSWRYHKQHNAWFQRYAEPTVTNEEYEQVWIWNCYMPA
jgi:CCR4-NOT transcriptional regulation complex NOT5 subunit